MSYRFVFCLATALAIAPAAVKAAVYNFTSSIPLSQGGTISGAGQITTQDSLTSGGYLVTGITGTYGGSNITGLLPVGTFGGNDNLVYYPANIAFLDDSGVSFSLDQDPGYREGTQINIFYSQGEGYSDLGDTGYSPNGFTLTPNVAVPEPGSLALLCGGLIGLTFVSRRRPAR